MTASDSDGNDDAAEELADYLRRESSGNAGDGGILTSPSPLSPWETRRRALGRLVESRLGEELTAAAGRSAATLDAVAAGEVVAGKADTEEGSQWGPLSVKGTAGEDGDWRGAADKIAGTPLFQTLLDAVAECAMRFMALTSSPTVSEESDGGALNEETEIRKANVETGADAETPQTSDANADASAAASPAADLPSFSLFDLIESQGIASALAPRIMARQVIEAHQRGKDGEESDHMDGESALELLEKADDIEDLSPDPESWEVVRAILYEGLLSTGSNEELRFRYLKAHESLIENCLGNNACFPQFWSLAQNLVGSVLALSCQFGGDFLARPAMDLRWDTMRSLLNALPQLATEHALSKVGNEQEVDRMLLGLCMILSDDFSSCIMGMMEPLAGTLEIWSRFVAPPRFVAAVDASSLGGAARQRCKSLGSSASSEFIWDAIQSSSKGGGADDTGSKTSLDDIMHCSFLQSLSILRTILLRCRGSWEAVSLIHEQFANETKQGPAMLSRFLSPRGVASPDDVEALLDEVQEKRRSRDRPGGTCVEEAIDSVLKPFRNVIRAKELDAAVVTRDLEVLCTQPIELYQRS